MKDHRLNMSIRDGKVIPLHMVRYYYGVDTTVQYKHRFIKILLLMSLVNCINILLTF